MRRCEYHSFNAGIPGGMEYSQRTFPSGHNQFVLMFRQTGGQGRRHMENIFAPRDRFRPTRIVFKISSDE
jgi:hypothetical protein